MQRVSVIIADDHHLFIAGIQTILKDNEQYEFDIIAVAHSGDELLDKLKIYKPDLVMLDLNMPGRDGLDALKSIRVIFPDLKIIALTSYDEPKIVKSAFKSGVDGYVLKNVGKPDLMKAIDDVMKGMTHLGRGVRISGGLDHITKPIVQTQSSFQFEDRFIKKYNLTKRELEILKLITLALSNKEIAKELYISDQTVSVHRKNIMRKLGVSNTAGLIKIAYDNSLI